MSVIHVPRDGKHLATELVKMVNNPAFSDIQFICKDGVKVYACRLLLAARSTMLEKMLTNGMLETTLAEIPLPTISSSALVPTLEFVYTGGIEQEKFNFEVGLEVLHAAGYFMLESLKQQVVHLLMNAVKVMTSIPNLVKYMSMVAELGCCDKLAHQIALSLEKADASWGFVKGMSLRTMQVYFRVSRGMNEEPALCLMEYLRLRQILLWCSLQVSPEAVTKMVIALPDEGLLMWYFELLKTAKSLEAIAPSLRYSNLTEIVARVKELGVDWSQVTRLQCIHPVLLYTVIKPLDVIPSHLFEAAFQYQGCHFGDMSVLKWVLKGQEYKGYQALDNGAVLWAVEGSGLPPVRVNMSISKRSGIFEFEVVIVEPASGMVIGVGSVPVPGEDGRRFAVEDYQAFVQSTSPSFPTPTYGAFHVDHFGKNSRIRVQVNMGERNCQFSSGQAALGTFKFDSREVVVFTRFDPPGKVQIVSRSWCATYSELRPMDPIMLINRS